MTTDPSPLGTRKGRRKTSLETIFANFSKAPSSLAAPSGRERQMGTPVSLASLATSDIGSWQTWSGSRVSLFFKSPVKPFPNGKCLTPFSHSKYDMFSTIATVLIPIEENIEMPFRASAMANLEGVVTPTAKLRSISWHTVNWTSPVPGGKSNMRTSKSPQSVPFRSCVVTLPAIGPRRIAAPPSLPLPGTPLLEETNPSESSLTPLCSIGYTIFLPNGDLRTAGSSR
mmetsp:Transcript_1258/g.2274  ORF Transcript_1258/g.2274 Transcript_1258/m.2274 type:complete len:228 (+) Transcript_1258:3105-3788(+)